MYGASASTSLWKILCSSTSFSTISRSCPYSLLFTFACIRTHSDMNRFHLKPYIQKKDGEVCLDTHQFLINYLSPVDGGSLLWSCHVVNVIMLLLELPQTHSQLFHTFSLRRKKKWVIHNPSKSHRKNIPSTEFCFHSIKHEMLLNILVQRWPCRRVIMLVLTPSQSFQLEGAANERLGLHLHPDSSAAPVSSGSSCWCPPGTRAACSHWSSWYPRNINEKHN